MKILLDTHTFLWFANGDISLSAKARQLIEDEKNDIFLSIASAWEMAIKYNLDKLHLPQSVEEFVANQLAINDFHLLDISLSHIAQIARLPRHHNDPFDRMLIVQALVEDFSIISVDDKLDNYDISRLW